MSRWRGDPNWALYSHDPAWWDARQQSPPDKPTIEAERSYDGNWASIVVTVKQNGVDERRTVATWLRRADSDPRTFAAARDTRRPRGAL